jgi:hypothetical protein
MRLSQAPPIEMRGLIWQYLLISILEGIGDDDEN